MRIKIPAAIGEAAVALVLAAGTAQAGQYQTHQALSADGPFKAVAIVIDGPFTADAATGNPSPIG
ncbi:hypothetical protein [Streptomyces capitiformicae]|uniref:Uncharacterized protein n=1 Tax=Streptomyces capitiformicae TaxID=2014920 RepID=A0A918ZKZ3_9ACTN|nr:hypothetical protein [Streptomyces capitiformicae]GHE58628.1 hypothetical protein GCM10017771_81660 [Streptomyces capitiformicae]